MKQSVPVSDTLVLPSVQLYFNLYRVMVRVLKIKMNPLNLFDLDIG